MSGKEHPGHRPIRQGDIYWLEGCRPLHGDVAKRRPVVVVSPTTAAAQSELIVVVACTSSVLPSNTSAIEIPSRERMPQARTGLSKRTWAIPQWWLPVHREALTDYAGRIGGQTLRRLLDAFAQAFAQSQGKGES